MLEVVSAYSPPPDPVPVPAPAPASTNEELMSREEEEEEANEEGGWPRVDASRAARLQTRLRVATSQSQPWAMAATVHTW